MLEKEQINILYQSSCMVIRVLKTWFLLKLFNFHRINVRHHTQIRWRGIHTPQLLNHATPARCHVMQILHNNRLLLCCCFLFHAHICILQQAQFHVSPISLTLPLCSPPFMEWGSAGYLSVWVLGPVFNLAAFIRQKWACFLTGCDVCMSYADMALFYCHNLISCRSRLLCGVSI